MTNRCTWQTSSLCSDLRCLSGLNRTYYYYYYYYYQEDGVVFF